MMGAFDKLTHELGEFFFIYDMIDYIWDETHSYLLQRSDDKMDGWSH